MAFHLTIQILAISLIFRMSIAGLPPRSQLGATTVRPTDVPTDHSGCFMEPIVGKRYDSDHYVELPGVNGAPSKMISTRGWAPGGSLTGHQDMTRFRAAWLRIRCRRK